MIQPTTEDRHPSQRSRPSVFFLYIIRYNRNGHGCRPRITGADHWPRVPVFWGLHPEGRRPRVPRRHGARVQGTPNGGTASGSRGANRGEMYPKRGQNGRKCDEKGLFGASEGVSRGIFAGRPGGACLHAPRSVAAALACESGVFEWLPRLIIS